MSRFVALAVIALAFGCNTRPTPPAPTEKAPSAATQLAEMAVPAVAAALKDNKVIAIDANNAETRAKYGVPRAVLLSTIAATRSASCRATSLRLWSSIAVARNAAHQTRLRRAQRLPAMPT